MTTKVNQTQTSNILSMQLERAAAMNRRGADFGTVLRERLNQDSRVQFSRHAAQRLEQRGIDMNDTFLDHLNQAVDKARDKGAKNVAVISERGAFIVNVPNNTVITTISGQEMKENIFTNIDSAVLL